MLAGSGPSARDLQGPVGYDGKWLVLAILGLVAVTTYYLAVLWWTRQRRPTITSQTSARAAYLARLDRIESDVSAGRVSSRLGHQQVSETVRGFVADTTGLPARQMTLADLEHSGPERLAAVVALLYPPEFGPGEDLGRDRFGVTLASARELVTTWT